VKDNPSFPQPVPSLQKVLAAAIALEQAETNANTGQKGLKALRNQKRSALAGLLNQLKAHVEAVANDDSDHVVSIVESSGMNVAAPSHPPKAHFSVRPGRLSGSVRLAMLAAAKVAMYEWQMSTDGGQTWKRLPPTLQAKTTVTGLTPGQTIWFRGRAVTRRVRGGLGEAVSVIVR
jgi:hypothetical protein